ncbi:IS1182 family transposase [Wenyingzhuangia sp. IMCC45574]
MQYLQKQPRTQITLFTTCLDDMIPLENSVRIIDDFVDSLDMAELGFNSLQTQGRPPYDPADLLKLYIYGYMNRIRSSRQLEIECKRNIELFWLMGNLKPDHNTISRFRKENPKAIKRVFRATVNIAKNHNLIGAVLIAGDSTKLRAQNSKKNNYNPKKVQRHIEYIDNKLLEHEAELAKEDEPDKREEIKQIINKRKEQKHKYNQIAKTLKGDTTSDNPQLSTSDPESRHQIVRGNITEVCYTAQTTVDEKHKIIIDYLITNQSDKKEMGTMLRRAKTILRNNRFVALYDKGYHAGSGFKVAFDLGIKTLVAIPNIGRKSQAPNPEYNAENFVYNHLKDSYTCPQKNELNTNGNWYTSRNYKFKQYRTSACKNCIVRSQCTTAKNGKIVQRTEYTEYTEINAKNVERYPDMYKKRQALVEHPYGTIKRQWGYDHIITKKGRKRASADFGLITIAYNLKRLIKLGWKAIDILFLTLKGLYRLLIREIRVYKGFYFLMQIIFFNKIKTANLKFLYF